MLKVVAVGGAVAEKPEVEPHIEVMEDSITDKSVLEASGISSWVCKTESRQPSQAAEEAVGSRSG
jgi:hypothetical protein